MNKIKLTIIVLLSMTLGVITFNKVMEIKNKVDYANCMSEYAGSNFIDCSTGDMHYVKVPIEVEKVEALSTTSVKSLDNAGATKKVEKQAEKTETIKVGKYTVKRDVAEKVLKTFGRDEKMFAIIFAESGFDSNKVNYNCYYAKSETGTYIEALEYSIDFNNVSEVRRKGDISWSCKNHHNKYSWSQDIGLLAVNTINGAEYGKLDKNLTIAKKLLNTGSYSQWSTYTLGLHTQFNDEAKLLLSQL